MQIPNMRNINRHGMLWDQLASHVRLLKHLLKGRKKTIATQLDGQLQFIQTNPSNKNRVKFFIFHLHSNSYHSQSLVCVKWSTLNEWRSRSTKLTNLPLHHQWHQISDAANTVLCVSPSAALRHIQADAGTGQTWPANAVELTALAATLASVETADLEALVAQKSPEQSDHDKLTHLWISSTCEKVHANIKWQF